MRTAGESNRWLQLYNADPVNTLRLSEYFRSQLQASLHSIYMKMPCPILAEQREA